MGENIPIPAETLRRLSDGTTEAIFEARADGRKATARSLQRSVSRAMDVSRNADGEFVSISANHVASLAAFGGHTRSGEEYHEGAVQFLEQYNYW